MFVNSSLAHHHFNSATAPTSYTLASQKSAKGTASLNLFSGSYMSGDSRASNDFKMT